MDGAAHKRVSKFLSYVLRHHPEAIALDLDDHGWAAIKEISEKAEVEGYNITESLIQDVIASGDKQRFILSDDKKYIRATYGHSIDVDLQLHPIKPPGTLYHGTARRHLAAIQREGLRPDSRKFVHLSAKPRDARQVGARHGKPVVLRIESRRMFQGGHDFFQSESEPGIWLTKGVPTRFIIVP